MGKRYLVGPFLAVLAPWIVGNGTIVLVPLYAVERGASEAGSGVFMAFAFACLALGTFAPGLLPRLFSRRRAFIVAAGVIIALALLLTSRTTSLLAFMACYGGAMFLFGIVGTLATILTGLAAPEKERGTAFGILGMTNGLGGLIGGFGAGWLAERFGFVGIWEGAAAVSVLVIAGGVLAVESRVEHGQPAGAGAGSLEAAGPTAPPARSGGFSAALVLLLAANLCLAFVNSASNMGRPFEMSEQGYSKLAINLTMSASGAVSVCISLALGWLSDRVGRRWIMIGSFLVAGAALLVLGFAGVLWQFYLFSCLAAFLSVPSAVGPAYVVDVVSREGTARGVALFQGVFWAGNIIGLMGLGFAFEHVGTTASVLYSALFPAAGVVLLLLIRKRQAAPRGVHPWYSGRQ